MVSLLPALPIHCCDRDDSESGSTCSLSDLIVRRRRAGRRLQATLQLSSGVTPTATKHDLQIVTGRWRVSDIERRFRIGQTIASDARDTSARKARRAFGRTGYADALTPVTPPAGLRRRRHMRMVWPIRIRKTRLHAGPRHRYQKSRFKHQR